MILILIVHFIADFVLQTDEQALKKSSSNYYLTLHVLTYTLGLGLAGFLLLPFGNALIWVLGNGIFHWMVDYCTSRLNSYLYVKYGRHIFFIGVGADQLIHTLALLTSYDYLN